MSSSRDMLDVMVEWIYEYLKDLAEGGCIMFNFGIESGSQKVLDDMAKGVTIKEMEQNFHRL